MTKEETKKRIEVMQAYVEGKTIQAYNNTTGEWVDKIDPNWIHDMVKYRVKPEPKLRPYTFEELKEAIKKHGGYVVDEEGFVYVIVFANDSSVRYYENSYEDFSDFMRNKWLDDNSPCGFLED